MKNLKKFRDEDGKRDPKRTVKKIKPKRSLGEKEDSYKKQPAYKYLEEEE